MSHRRSLQNCELQNQDTIPTFVWTLLQTRSQKDSHQTQSMQEDPQILHQMSLC